MDPPRHDRNKCTALPGANNGPGFSSTQGGAIAPVAFIMSDQGFATTTDATNGRRRISRRTPVALVMTVWAIAGPGALAQAQAIKPFKIHIEEAVIVDLKDRLARTRWPEQIPGSGWDYGVEIGYLRQLVEYWRTSYDWRKHERALNEFPQFTAEIDGVPIHFIHRHSKSTDALPLVIIHGWPGSIYEFHKIIGPLTEPEDHGGKPEDAFHVVCPSLPGFGFSGQPKERGWSSQRMAEAIAKLMARLGYTRYGAQGGDWGAGIRAGWPPTTASTASAGTVIFLRPASPVKSQCAASHRRKSSGCGIVPPNSTTSGPTAQFRARGRRRWVTP